MEKARLAPKPGLGGESVITLGGDEGISLPKKKMETKKKKRKKKRKNHRGGKKRGKGAGQDYEGYKNDMGNSKSLIAERDAKAGPKTS